MNERGDLFKGESSTFEKPLDHLRLALLDSLPDSQLNSLLESHLEIFFHPGIDDVLSHSYLPLLDLRRIEDEEIRRSVDDVEVVLALLSPQAHLRWP